MPTEVRADYRITFAVLAIGMTAYSLLQSTVSPLLPLLQHDLHTTQNTVTWVLTAYLLSASVATPILGRVADAYGKKKVLLIVLGALMVGSVLAAIATSITVMIIARAVQGIAGGIMPVAFGIIRDEFPREKVTSAIGVMAALLAVGGGVGVAVAGPIVSALNRHWLFLIPAMVVSIAAVMTFFFVPESRQLTPGPISLGGAFLLSSWLVAVLVGASQAPSWGWLSWRVLGLFGLGIVLAAAWVLAELRARTPLVDMRMLRLPAVRTTNAAALLFGVGMYTSFAVLPEFFQTPHSAGYGFGASITESGLIMLPQAAVMFVTGSSSGPLAARLGGRVVMVLASGLGACGFLFLAFAHAEVWEGILGTSIMGAGFGLGFAGMTAIVIDAVPSHQTGVASGMNANIRTIGGAVGAAVVSSIVTAQLQAGGLPREVGYTRAFVVLAGAMAVGGLASMLIPRVPHHTDEHSLEQLALAHPQMAVVAGATIVGDDPE